MFPRKAIRKKGTSAFNGMLKCSFTSGGAPTNISAMGEIRLTRTRIHLKKKQQPNGKGRRDTNFVRTSKKKKKPICCRGSKVQTYVTEVKADLERGEKSPSHFREGRIEKGQIFPLLGEGLLP